MTPIKWTDTRGKDRKRLGSYDGEVVLSVLDTKLPKDVDFTKPITIEFTTHGLRTRITLESIE